MTGSRPSCARAAGVSLVLGCLLGATLGAQVPGAKAPRATRLLVELGGERLPDWLPFSNTEPVSLTVTALDSAGNVVPITDFEIQVWDERIAVVTGTTTMGDRMGVDLRPLRHGQTTIQIRASGVRDWLHVEVLAPISIAGPARPAGPGAAPAGGGAPGPGYWFAGFRVNGAGYKYSFLDDSVMQGRAAFFGELVGGRAISPSFSVSANLALGVAKVDSIGTSLSASLIELYFRGDLSFTPDKKVSPVLSFGGGGFRIRTGGVGAGIWNTSLMWTLSGGVDFVLSPKATGELRVGTQQLYEATSSHVNGYVGSLFVVGAGVRFKL